MIKKLENFINEYEDLQSRLADPEVLQDPQKIKQYNQKLASMEDGYQIGKKYMQVCEELAQAKEMLEDSEMHDMAKEEADQLQTEKDKLYEELKVALLPKDPMDQKDVIIEIRA